MSECSVAVIGANGFIGSALVAALHARGCKVDAYSSSRPFIRKEPDDAPIPDRIVYLASTINPAIADREPERASADVATLRASIEALSSHSGKATRFVLLSSGGTVYDPECAPPYSEQSSTRPVSRYGQAKLDMERVVLERSFSGTIEPVVLRMSSLYGPDQPVGTGQGVIINWLHAAATGEPAVLFGGGSATRDYLYIGDAVEAICRALETESPSSPLNIGSGQPTTLAELADLIENVVGGEFRVVRAAARGFDVAESYLDIGAAQRSLAWSPTTPLATGLALTWAHLQDVRD